MITPSTDVARGGISNTETRSASRAESGADFREEVSRERARERTNDRARVDDPARSDAADARPRADGEREAGASRDEPTADGSQDATTGGADDTRTAPSDQAAGAAESDAQPAARSTTSGEPKQSLATPRVARSEPESIAAGVPVAIVAPALEASSAVPFTPTGGRPSADANAPAVSAPVDEAASGVARVSAKSVAGTAGLASDVQLALPDAPAHDATLPEGFELPREVRSAHASEGGANALAVAARGTASVADLSPAAAAAPVATPRLAPAELPQFLGDLQVHVDGAAGSALVELEPLELGRLTVELSLQPEGGVRADVRAERPDGYAAVEARLPELRASLMDRGFASADVQISLGLAPRDPRRDSETGQSRRAQRNTARQLDAERVLALAPTRTGSIDLWA